MDVNDWQINKKQNECNRYILENEVFCDVKFRVGSDGEVIKAHKLLLASRSPVFEKMFFGSLSSETGPVVIPDIEPAPFNALLKYCYYECLDLDPDLALATLYAAKKYMLPLLEDVCRDIQVENLSTDNIWVVYTSSISNPDEKLCESCRRFITNSASNISVAFQSPEYLEIPFTTLLDLLQINEADMFAREPRAILISEIELFNACNRWAEAECLRQKLEPSGPNKRSVLGDCLFLIRFPTMMHSDLVNIVSPTNILTTDERINVLEMDSLVQPFSMFPFEKHTIMVSLDSRPGRFSQQQSFFGHNQPMEVVMYSLTKKSQVYFSEIKVESKDRIALEGIQYNACSEKDGTNEFEIAVDEQNSRGTVKNVWCTTVSSMNRKDSEGKQFVYVPLEPNKILEPGYKYSIRVARMKKLPTEPNNSNISYIAKKADLVNLEIIHGAKNEAITALFFHIV